MRIDHNVLLDCCYDVIQRSTNSNEKLRISSLFLHSFLGKTRPADGAIEIKLFLVLPGIGCKYLVKENPSFET